MKSDLFEDRRTDTVPSLKITVTVDLLSVSEGIAELYRYGARGVIRTRYSPRGVKGRIEDACVITVASEPVVELHSGTEVSENYISVQSVGRYGIGPNSHRPGTEILSSGVYVCHYRPSFA